MTQQRDSIAAVAPPFLQGENGSRYLYVMTLMSDVLLEKANQGMKAHMPGQGDPSAIPLLCDDRVLTRGLNETDDAISARLQRAFDTWAHAGSRPTILEEIAAYLGLYDAQASAQLPAASIVGGNATFATWSTIFNTTPIGAQPARAQISPSNWNWDGLWRPWRCWLILYMSITPTGITGSSASVTTAGGASSRGQNVNGVWVPGGPSVGANAFLTITGLSGLTSSDAKKWITFSGAASSGNNGPLQVSTVLSSSSCVVANPNGVANDANNGAISWSLGSYDIIGPGPVWGASGATWGDATVSIGLSVPASTVATIRSLLATWKAARTYYPQIVVAFDGADLRAGSQFSPWSAPGSGNPNGTYGSLGINVNGVWVPSESTQSPYDAFCDGTGRYVQCSVQNAT